MTQTEIISLLNPQRVTIIGSERSATTLVYDSRKVIPGCVFVALRGLTTDGHHYINDALQMGAHSIICETFDRNQIPTGFEGAIVEVDNTRKALAALAHAWHGYPSRHLRVIGVTGTNGKTTTTFIARKFFEARGETVGIIGTTGNFIGNQQIPTDFTTPEAPELCTLFAQMHNAGVTTVVMEVSSHALMMERVSGTTFAGAIFTNLTQDHLDFHSTMEEYAFAKKRLFDMLPPEAVAVVNHDDAYSDFMVRDCRAKTLIRFGRSASCDVLIQHEHLHLQSTDCIVTIGQTAVPNPVEIPVTIALVGRFNIDNMAGCLGLMWGLGWNNVAEISRVFSLLQPAPGRMQRLFLPNGAVAIVDYAHTPDALEKALLSCREILQSSDDNKPGTLWCVFGCGGDRDRTKRPKMGKIAAMIADKIITTSDNPRTEDPRQIIQEIVQGIPTEHRDDIRMMTDRAQAIRYALSLAQPGDLVLIAGKGHENYQIIGKEKIHFDDCEEILQFCHAHSGSTAISTGTYGLSQ